MQLLTRPSLSIFKHNGIRFNVNFYSLHINIFQISETKCDLLDSCEGSCKITRGRILGRNFSIGSAEKSGRYGMVSETNHNVTSVSIKKRETHGI